MFVKVSCLRLISFWDSYRLSGFHLSVILWSVFRSNCPLEYCFTTIPVSSSNFDSESTLSADPDLALLSSHPCCLVCTNWHKDDHLVETRFNIHLELRPLPNQGCQCFFLLCLDSSVCYCCRCHQQPQMLHFRLSGISVAIWLDYMVLLHVMRRVYSWSHI